MTNTTEKVYYVRYTCRDMEGHIVDQFDDMTNLVSSWKEAKRWRDMSLDCFNADCRKGIWRGVIKTL